MDNRQPKGIFYGYRMGITGVNIHNIISILIMLMIELSCADDFFWLPIVLLESDLKISTTGHPAIIFAAFRSPETLGFFRV
jgi:hypothetical protein